MKWAIREAVDVYFKAKGTFQLGARVIRAGEPVLIFDTVKTSTMEVATETSYVTGGRGNVRLLAYEGDKTMNFTFEESLLSAEGLAILSGAELIPARNPRLAGSSGQAKSVISHFTERVQVTTSDLIDTSPTNILDGKKIGGLLNVHLTRKPYIGHGSSIYVMLLDKAGEMSGAPLEVNLGANGDYCRTVEDLKARLIAMGSTTGAGSYLGVSIADVAAPTSTELEQVNAIYRNRSFISKFSRADNKFVAFDKNGAPMKKTSNPDPSTRALQGKFDDTTAHYVDVQSVKDNWSIDWGDVADIETEYVRTIESGSSWAVIGAGWDPTISGVFGYLVGQPKAYREGSAFVYKLNVPSILQNDTVLLDYYIEHFHDAVQVSITPDRFAQSFYVEGSSLLKRASDGVDLPVEFIIPNLKIQTALTFNMTSSGDPSTFTFNGEAFPDYTKFSPTQRVFADIQIIGADDNYDSAGVEGISDAETSYRRFQYDENKDGHYIWKDPSIPAHANLDYSDTAYDQSSGGPVTQTPGSGSLG